MKEIIQLYSDTFKGIFPISRNLIFIAEGYKASDETLFYKDVYELLNRLEKTFPFTLLKGKGSMFSAFTSFTPSAQTGYATSQAQSIGRTVFETYFVNGQLHVNNIKINEYIDQLVYNVDRSPVFIKNRVAKGDCGSSPQGRGG